MTAPIHAARNAAPDAARRPDGDERDERGDRDDRDDRDEGGERDDEHDDDRTDDEHLEAIHRLKTDIAIARSRELSTLEERLYKHVLDCIDFDALFGLEQMLWHAVEDLGHGALENDAGLSHRLIERALTRAAHDSSNAFRDVPFGITKAEERAVRFDAECLFCEYEDQLEDVRVLKDDGHENETETDNQHDGTRENEHARDEVCALCNLVAREWRAAHADQLRAAADRRAARVQRATPLASPHSDTTEPNANPSTGKA